ncbi:MAG TPA: CHAT domain-containing protein [Thermoanaerobaculia bacterium]|nr:CHAT domain-containing protein [Thermoanaerobaculia bacterium]
MRGRRLVVVTALALILGGGSSERPEQSAAQESGDLAAQFYSEGVCDDDALLIFRALAAADHALRIDPQDAEALRHRRDALEALHLSGYGVVDQSARLRVGPALRVAAQRGDEAEVVRLVRQFPEDARTWAEGQSLAEWAYGVRSGQRDSATRELDVARAVGRALLSTSGEALVAEAVRAIDDAITSNDHQRVTVLAEAHEQYEEAARRRRYTWPREVAFALDEAVRGFERGRSPMQWAARIAGLNVEPPPSSMIQILGHRIFRTDPPEFLALRAKLHWHESLHLAKRGDFTGATRACLRAIDLFEGLGEHRNVGILRNIEANFLGMMSDRVASWRMRRSALASAEAGDPLLAEEILRSATRDAITMREWDIARSLASLLIDVKVPPKHLRNSMLRTEALLMRAIAAWNQSHVTNAAHDLSRARASVAAAGQNLDFMREWVDAIEAAIKRGKAPPQWGEALALHSAREASERSALDLTTSVYELSNLTPFGHLRDTFSDETYDELLDLLDRHGLAASAFTLNETRRTHLLLARMGYGDRTFIGVKEIRKILPPRTAILAFASLEDRLLIFTIDDAGFRLTRNAVTRDELARRVAAFTAEMANGGDARSAAQDLYQTLFGPLNDVDTLVIVPDETLAPIPFAALVHPATGRYLAEDMAVVIAPSAGVFAQLASTPRPPLRSALVVGDPAFDHDEHPLLPRLPAAAGEARTIARMYPSQLLLGEEASATSFLERISEADVAHVAAHADIDARDPMRSGIVMAKGRLSIRDIVAQRVKPGSVAVLVGCRTAERNGDSDVSSLVLAFLAAGSRSSVGALWNVEDAVTRHFSVRLHELLREGVKVSEAVRQTQVEMLRSSDPAQRDVRAWAGFQVYGGD